MISFKAKQRFRQRLQNIENADEILTALDEFVERFTLISGSFLSNQFQTIYEYVPKVGETVMITYSVLGRENEECSGFKRTALFYRNNIQIIQINTSQTDFTAKSNSNSNARLLIDGNSVKLQVKGSTENLTHWQGSIEIEKLGE
jgi:hypothetical protein